MKCRISTVSVISPDLAANAAGEYEDTRLIVMFRRKACAGWPPRQRPAATSVQVIAVVALAAPAHT